MKYCHYLNFFFNLQNYNRNLVFIYLFCSYLDFVCFNAFFGKLIHICGSKIQSRLRETKSLYSYFTLLCGVFDM